MGDTFSFATYLGAHSWSQDITLRFSFSVYKSYQESDQVTRAQNQKSEGLVHLLHQGLEGLNEWLNCRMDTSCPSLWRWRAILDGLFKIYAWYRSLMVCDAGVDYSKPGLRRGQVKNLSLSSPSPSLFISTNKQSPPASWRLCLILISVSLRRPYK